MNNFLLNKIRNKEFTIYFIDKYALDLIRKIFKKIS
jgi:hypothetical protein